MRPLQRQQVFLALQISAMCLLIEIGVVEVVLFNLACRSNTAGPIVAHPPGEPGDGLPGVFANNSLYLQTIRLTTSYQTSVDDLHVDLFAFSGDATRNRPTNGWKPTCNDVPHGLNQTLLGLQGVRDEKITLFCQLDVDSSTFKMAIVRVISADHAQTMGTLIWRCNVTKAMNKPQLIELIDNNLIAGAAVGALRVHLLMQRGTAQSIVKFGSFLIPLDTGSLGVGSIDVRGGVATSYFHQSPVAAGLCVSTYGMKPLPYLSEFVQHHLNVGFGSIVIGVKGLAGSDELRQTQRILQKYIDRGEVALTHYHSPFTCDKRYGTAVDQMQFYQPCLYHHKGLTKYSANWDVDEYWTPPPSLDVNGTHNSSFSLLTLDENITVVTPGNETAIEPGMIINASSWSTFPHPTRSDTIWQQSPYAQAVSISDTLDAIERYYVLRGCKSFCFHIFPSHVVFARKDLKESNRSKSVGKDFEQRKVSSEKIWHKSVVNTIIAHMAGVHVAGSCYFEESLDPNEPYWKNAEKFHMFSNNSQVAACNPRTFEHKVYGSIHHFFDLIVLNRWPLGLRPGDNVTELDEYVSLYASTVDAQIMDKRQK